MPMLAMGLQNSGRNPYPNILLHNQLLQLLPLALPSTLALHFAVENIGIPLIATGEELAVYHLGEVSKPCHIPLIGACLDCTRGQALRKLRRWVQEETLIQAILQKGVLFLFFAKLQKEGVYLLLPYSLCRCELALQSLYVLLGLCLYGPYCLLICLMQGIPLILEVILMRLQIHPRRLAPLFPLLHLPISGKELSLELLDPALFESQLILVLCDHYAGTTALAFGILQTELTFLQLKLQFLHADPGCITPAYQIRIVSLELLDFSLKLRVFRVEVDIIR